MIVVVDTDKHIDTDVLCGTLDRLGFEEWFAANRDSLTSEFSPSKDEAELTVLAMKKYRKLLKVIHFFAL